MYYALINTQAEASLVTWPTEHKDIAFTCLERRTSLDLSPVLYLVTSNGDILQTHYMHPEVGLITEDETAQEIHAKFALHV